ncbi:hypothetical protein KQI58_09770 [Enterococcus raffinosus]|uniref:hypothetical protein n=1 Tax=Enterococcus raffinosus TaxID=71452 RepID=UPI001C0FD6D2|nr:hypothetical protein [Enterococcus raffinosus]MBU5361363.1 hypothetical protein [Enterococcus raffinosus]
MTLPTFPTIDLTDQVEWMVKGFTGIVTANAGIVIGGAVIMAFAVMAIAKVKGFAKKAVR